MMSKKCKYALKALSHLAQNEGKIVKSADLARLQNIPKKFLEHILITLKSNSLVASKQGSEGGYYLLKPAKDIQLSEVYRLFDGAIALLPCVSERFYEPCSDCLSPETCKMKFIFAEIRLKTFDMMAEITIDHFLPD